MSKPDKNPDPFPNLPRRSFFQTAPIEGIAGRAEMALATVKTIAEKREIAKALGDELGVGIQLAKRGRPAKGAASIEGQKPWEAEGVSRKTWYKRRKVARSK